VWPVDIGGRSGIFRTKEVAMAVMMIMRWAGVTPRQYDDALEVVRWEQDVPPGGMFHVAGFDEHGLHVTDVWESAEQFQRFVDDRLMPGVAQVGIEGQPEVEVLPVHRLFTPAFAPA
jgi:hypothetical protein